MYTDGFVQITNKESEVLSVISSLKNKNVSGIDELSNGFIKNIRDEIIVPVIYLINLTMSKGVFPRALKKSVVKPLMKKGSKMTPSNHLSQKCSKKSISFRRIVLETPTL